MDDKRDNDAGKRPRPPRKPRDGETGPARSGDRKRESFRGNRTDGAAASAGGDRKPRRFGEEKRDAGGKSGFRPKGAGFGPKRREGAGDAGGGAERARPFVRGEGGAGESRGPRRERSNADKGGGEFRRPKGAGFGPRQGGGAGERDARPQRTRPFVRREDGAGEGAGPKTGRRERDATGEGLDSGNRPKTARGDGAREGDRSFRPRPDGKGRGSQSFEPRERAGQSRDRAGRSPRSTGREGGDAATGAGADGERIAKRLARAGIASRREAESLVEDGRVKVNGKVLASPAVTVTEADRIEIDGHPIPAIERTRLFLFHKPAGVVTTNHDPEGRRTVFEVLPENLPRLITVGRLDINTEGLLLLTNDGGLSRVLELPATGWLRRYRVRVHGTVDEKALADLRHGSSVDGVFYGAVEAELERVQGSNAWLTIGLREGKNREVKNILGSLGLDVNRLIRISFGPFQLGELGEGEVQEIKGKMLREQLGERLVHESGANFDAAVAKPFPNRPVRRGFEEEAAPRPVRAPRPLQEGEGGLIKRGRMDRSARRDDALGRLSTKPPPGRKAGGGRAKREEEAPRDRRTANVWMAPGARPEGKKPAKPRSGDDPRPSPTGKGKPRGGKPGADRRR